jgi:hypothetical protein
LRARELREGRGGPSARPAEIAEAHADLQTAIAFSGGGFASSN